MPFKTEHGTHYHMKEGCNGATIPCGTEGLTPCSICCEGVANGHVTASSGMASGTSDMGGHGAGGDASYEPGTGSGMPGVTAEATSAGQPGDFGHSHLTRAFVIAELGTNAFSDSQDAPRPTISEEEVMVDLAEMGTLPDNSQASTFAERSKRRLWQARGWPKQAISSGIAGNVPSGAEFVGSVGTVSVFACPDGNSPFSDLLQRRFLPPNRRDDHRQVMAVDSTGKNLNLERNWGATPVMDALIANVPKETRLVGSSSSSSMFVAPSESEPYDSVDLIYVQSPKDGRRIDGNGNQRRTIQRTTVRMERYYAMSHKGWKPETMMYAISHDVPAKYEYLGTKDGSDPNGGQSWFFSYYGPKDDCSYVKVMDKDGNDITERHAGNSSTGLPVSWKVGATLPDGRSPFDAWHDALS